MARKKSHSRLARIWVREKKVIHGQPEFMGSEKIIHGWLRDAPMTKNNFPPSAGIPVAVGEDCCAGPGLRRLMTVLDRACGALRMCCTKRNLTKNTIFRPMMTKKVIHGHQNRSYQSKMTKNHFSPNGAKNKSFTVAGKKTENQK